MHHSRETNDDMDTDVMDQPVDERTLPTPDDDQREEDSGAPADRIVPPDTSAESSGLRRSSRVRKRTERMQESLEQNPGLLTSLYVPWDVYHDQAMDEQDDMRDPVSFAASTNPDVLYYNEAMAADDSEQFSEAMMKEVKSHENNEHWQIVRRSDVPEDMPILPSVWAFRRKRRIATNEVYKWKARINVHGGKQIHGINYWDTYAPVVSWPTVRLFLISMVLNDWKSRQIDFVLAFPQAEIECDMYMEVPIGFTVDGPRDKYALKLVRNLYGQKQAGRVWNTYMHEGLLARGFKQSAVDMCVYYRGPVALMIYTDDGIFIGPTDRAIEECFVLLSNEYTDHNGKKYRAFNITDEGTLSDYLGVEIKRLPNGTIKLSQPHMIRSILKDLGVQR